MKYPFSPSTALIANGEINSHTQTKTLLSGFTQLVAVDGGLEHCDKMNITPHMIIGDLDSVSPSLLKKYSKVPTQIYPTQKNESDLELAVQEVFKQGIDSMAMFGVLGKRSDHLLYTLYLLTKYPSQLIIQSENETIFCLQNQNIITASPGQTLSLVPLGVVTEVVTQGLKWDIQKATMDKTFMSLSNICLGSSFEVRLSSGPLLCFLQTKSVIEKNS